MNLTHSLLKTGEPLQETPVLAMMARGITNPLFNRATSPASSALYFVAPNSLMSRPYVFAEYQAARSAVKVLSRQASLDDETERNALWVLDQLEYITYAPEVASKPDGSFSFEWKSERGFGQIEIGKSHSNYYVQAYGGGRIEAEGNYVEVIPHVSHMGVVLDALLFPTSATLCIGSPNASGQIVNCLAFTDCASAAGTRGTAGDGLLAPAVREVLHLANAVEFEDGMENEFTLRIMSLVREKGAKIVKEILRQFSSDGISSEIFGQTLLCFGRIEDPSTYTARSNAARTGLRSPSAIVRDAAVVTIESLQDLGARAELRAAIAREQVPSLKEDMELVLAYLENRE